MKIYVVLRHNYYTDEDVIVFATSNRNYAKNYCEKKNQSKWACSHYRVKGMKLKEAAG